MKYTHGVALIFTAITLTACSSQPVQALPEPAKAIKLRADAAENLIGKTGLMEQEIKS